MNLIYDSFNPVFFGVFILSFVIYKLLAGYAKKRGPEFSRKFLTAITGIGFIIYFIYKFLLSKDVEYDIIIAGEGGFQWGSELPFAFCNVILWLIPVSLLTGNRYLQGYCFLAGPIGTIFAIALPCAGFAGYSIFTPRVFFYLLLHYLGFWASIALGTLGLYRPERKDILPTLAITIVLSFCAFIINNIFVATGFSSSANYFFTMYPSPGNPILEALFRLIPVKFVYILPLAVVLCLYMLGLISLMEFVSGQKQKRSPLP